MNRFLNGRRALRGWCFGLLVASVALTGCGGDRIPVAPVEGKVLYHGKPLKFGTVTFQPAAGPLATGEIGPDGVFRLSTYGNKDGAVVGMHKVAVSCFEAPPPPEPGTEPGLGKLLIPERYLNSASSGLNAEVKARNEPFEFVLTD